MTIGSRFKKAIRGARDSAQVTKGRAAPSDRSGSRQRSRLRREGRVDEAKGRLNQFAKKIKEALKR